MDDEVIGLLSERNDDLILDAFFKHTLSPVAILDRYFNFIRVNEAYAKADNRDVSEFPGHNHFEFYPSDAKAIFEQVVKTRQPYKTLSRPFTYSSNPERGTTYWDWSLVPVLGAGGEVELLIFSLVDVTERVKIEMALQRSNERFSKAFNANPSAMAILTLRDERYIAVNDSFESITGYRRGEVLSRTSSELNLQADRSTSRKMPEILKEQGSFENLEIEFPTKSGEMRIGLASGTLIELNGEHCILTSIIDITERKRLYKEIARLDRLNLIGEMAAGLGHEIRNPITTVRGFLQILGNKNEGHNREFYNLMIEEMDRVNSIITEFLTMAKDKAVHLKKKSLNGIVKAMLPLIQADAMNTDKYAIFELGEIPDLLLDEKEIKQVILNLARNGLEAMPPKGVLIIKTYADGDEVVLTVKDNGAGMAPEVYEKLGTPFFTTKDNGTGLGLAICYSITKRHNAQIKVETGHTGTTFYVRFKPAPTLHGLTPTGPKISALSGDLKATRSI